VGEFSGASLNLIGTNGNGTSDVLERNVISGNDGWGISIEGSGVSIDQTVIAGNYIGTNAAGDAAIPNTEGGVEVSSWGTNTLIGTDGDGIADGVEGNVISGNGGPGVLLTSSTSSGTVIAGNYIGIDAAGDAALPNLYGVQIQYGSTNNLIGTDADGTSDELERNVISGNDSNGILFSGDSDQNVVAGNYIGTDAAGNAALPNNKGIRIVQCSNNRIGGTLAAERNVISGNQSAGVVFDSASANLVQGNYIGTGDSGSGNLGNEGPGVSLIEGSFDNTIGGTTSGAANRITFNGTDGIILGDDCYGNNLRGNAIFANGDLGIDLYPGNSVTPNDLGDGDGGANNLQNYPVLSSVTSNGGQTAIQGTLNSSGNTTYNLDFYANSSCDPSGYGEGELYLGSDTVTTDGSGNASFTATLPGSVPAGTCVTATATDPGGNTSEFSACVGVEGSTAVYLPLVIRNYD
jgi:titin